MPTHSRNSRRSMRALTTNVRTSSWKLRAAALGFSLSVWLFRGPSGCLLGHASGKMFSCAEARPHDHKDCADYGPSHGSSVANRGLGAKQLLLFASAANSCARRIPRQGKARRLSDMPPHSEISLALRRVGRSWVCVLRQCLNLLLKVCLAQSYRSPSSASLLAFRAPWAQPRNLAAKLAAFLRLAWAVAAFLRAVGFALEGDSPSRCGSSFQPA
jgi:hypothetical protein